MAAFNLVSLVLRGVAVLCDRVNVELRLGASYKASPGTPEIPFSMRHPSQGITQEPFGNPADQPERIDDVYGADSGAGRSLGLAGVLSRSIPTTFVGRTLLAGSVANGATVFPTTGCLSSLAKTATTAGQPATSGSLVSSTTMQAITAGVKPRNARLHRNECGEAWCKPATRTPPASTWGRGSR